MLDTKYTKSHKHFQIQPGTFTNNNQRMSHCRRLQNFTIRFKHIVQMSYLMNLHKIKLWKKQFLNLSKVNNTCFSRWRSTKVSKLILSSWLIWVAISINANLGARVDKNVSLWWFKFKNKYSRLSNFWMKHFSKGHNKN